MHFKKLIFKIPEFQPLIYVANKIFEGSNYIHIFRNGNEVISSSMQRSWFSDDYMNKTIVNWTEPDIICNKPWYLDDESKMLLGVLSEKDCLRIFANKAFNQIPTGLVADYMSKSMKSLHPDDDLFKVAELFLKNPFRRLPVIEHGILIGQVSRYDVLLEGSRRIG